MALRPVSLREAQAILRRKEANSPRVEVRGRWTPVFATPAPACCGVTVARLDSCADGVQSCVGQVVIQPYCPPLPPPTIEDERKAQSVEDAIKRALVNVPQIVTQPSPLTHPGYRGRRESVTRVIVVNGLNAAAVAAGGALLAAAGGAVGAAALGIVQVQGSGAAPFVLFQVPIPSTAAQVERLRMTSMSVGAQTTLFFRVSRSGSIVVPEFQFVAGDEIPLQFPAQGDQVVAVEVRNPDADGAWLLHLQLDLWTYDIPVKADSAFSQVLRTNPSWPRECRAPVNGGRR
jgi:hypothetical protein